jgi:hypothetical protein
VANPRMGESSGIRRIFVSLLVDALRCGTLDSAYLRNTKIGTEQRGSRLQGVEDEKNRAKVRNCGPSWSSSLRRWIRCRL